jgi:sucrose phosphorylase
LHLSPAVFSVLRTSPEGDQHILAMVNVTNQQQSVKVKLSELAVESLLWFDIINNREVRAQKEMLVVNFEPYDVVWLICGEELKKSYVERSAGPTASE